MAQERIQYVLELIDKASKELDDVKRSAEGASDGLDDASDSSGGLGAALAKNKGPLQAAVVALAAIGFAAAKTGMASVAFASQLENLEVRLKFFVGGAENAKARVQELFEITKSTPFLVDDLVEADVALRAFGVDADKELQTVMDFAAAQGMALSDSARAIGQAFALGAGGAEVLRKKGVIEMIKLKTGIKATDMSLGEFRKNLMETIGTEFKGAADDLSLTFDGIMSNLQGKWQNVLKDVADLGVFEEVKKSLNGVLEVMNKNEEAAAALARTTANVLIKSLRRLGIVLSRIAAAASLVRLAFAELHLMSNELQIAFLQERMTAQRDRFNQIANNAKSTAVAVENAGRQMIRAETDLANALLRRQEIQGDTSGIAEQIEALFEAEQVFGSINTSLQTTTATGADRTIKKTVEEEGKEAGASAFDSLWEGMKQKIKDIDVDDVFDDLVTKLPDIVIEPSVSMKIADALGDVIAPSFSSVIQGNVAGVTGPLAAMGPQGMIAAASIDMLTALGDVGAEAAGENIKALVDGVLAGILELPVLLAEVLPEIIETLIVEIADQLPELVWALINGVRKAMPMMVISVMTAIVKVMWDGFAFLMQSIGLGWLVGERKEYQTGGYVDRTGMALVHAGEYVVPAGGGGTQTARSRMGGGGGGVQLTINTNVVDPNAIPSLVRQIERVFGVNGRATSTLFSTS